MYMYEAVKGTYVRQSRSDIHLESEGYGGSYLVDMATVVNGVSSTGYLHQHVASSLSFSLSSSLVNAPFS